MDRNQALRELQSRQAHRRLAAARVLGSDPRPEDEPVLRAALQKETVTWTKRAIRSAIDGLSRGGEPALIIPDDRPQDVLAAAADARAIAIEQTTRELLHEIEPILGALRVAGGNELPDYAQSESCRLHARLDALLQAIAALSKSAASARPREFDLGELIYLSSEEESARASIPVERSGMRPLLVNGDPALVELAFRNGLRNALEATALLPPQDRKPVVVAWGDTDKDAWAAVLDTAGGLPSSMRHAWEIGSSTKLGHLGMGLAIAKSAVYSMRGTVVLLPRDEGGARFEFRWPIHNGGVDEAAPG